MRVETVERRAVKPFNRQKIPKKKTKKSVKRDFLYLWIHAFVCCANEHASNLKAKRGKEISIYYSEGCHRPQSMKKINNF